MYKKKENESVKKGNDEFAVGIAATIGFAAAFVLTRMWFLVFPLVFIGLIPLFVGISKLLKRGKTPGKVIEQGSGTDKEKEILKVARESGGRLTVLQVASQTSLSIEDAREALDAMAKKGYIQLIVEASGLLRYEIPEFFTDEHKDDLTKQIEKPE